MSLCQEGSNLDSNKISSITISWKFYENWLRIEGEAEDANFVNQRFTDKGLSVTVRKGLMMTPIKFDPSQVASTISLKFFENQVISEGGVEDTRFDKRFTDKGS